MGCLVDRRRERLFPGCVLVFLMRMISPNASIYLWKICLLEKTKKETWWWHAFVACSCWGGCYRYFLSCGYVQYKVTNTLVRCLCGVHSMSLNEHRKDEQRVSRVKTFCKNTLLVKMRKREGKKKEKLKGEEGITGRPHKENAIHTKGEWCQAQRTYLEQPAVLQGKPFSHTVCRRQRVGSLFPQSAETTK